ncbi:MAG TPA: ABC transporter permease, partial [Vicinamibacterales bacterium]|nr:ABC transporter permease [Vicinamibacterales bacterium]
MRIYRWLLRLSPEALRRDYGAAMEDMFARRLTEARRRGAGYVAHVWGREVAGLLALALSERFGAVARTRHRQQRRLSRPKAGVMDVTTQEIWQATRRLARTPLFTFTAALTLALAIAANAAIFTVVNRVVVNPLPYPQSDRLIALDYGIPSRNIASGMTSMAWQLYFHLVDHARTLQHVAVYDSGAGTITGSGVPERLQITRATPSLTSVLGVQPAIGRWFIEPEGVTGAAPVVVLSHGLWVRRFGSDRSIVGRSITFDGVPTEVVGVMPATFSFPDSRTDMWMAAQSTRATASFLFTLTGVARLQDGATIETARTEITSLIETLSRVVTNQRGLTSTAIPLQESLVGRIARALWTLMAA